MTMNNADSYCKPRCPKHATHGRKPTHQCNSAHHHCSSPAAPPLLHSRTSCQP
jgi:hypothetical protein